MLKIFRLCEIKDVLLFFRGCLAVPAPVFSHLLTLSCAAVQNAGCDQQTTVRRAAPSSLRIKISPAHHVACWGEKSSSLDESPRTINKWFNFFLFHLMYSTDVAFQPRMSSDRLAQQET